MKIFRIFRYFQLHVQLLTLIWLLVKVQAPGVVVHTSPVPETWSVPHNGATNHSQLSPGIVQLKAHVIPQTYHMSAFIEFEEYAYSCILYENIDQILPNK